MKEKIVIQDLHKSFGAKVVLDGIDLTVYEHEILCIIGFSGVGKSVILKNLIGTMSPDSGAIFVDGVEFTGADAETRLSILSKYGILFQGSALEFSGGMQKRTGLARSIALRPEIMLYDEPTTGMDPITGGAVDRLIRKTRDSFGVTSIVVTHDMRSACRLADRIAMLYEGTILYTGTPDDFRGTCNVHVQQFIEGRAHGPIQVL